MPPNGTYRTHQHRSGHFYGGRQRHSLLSRMSTATRVRCKYRSGICTPEIRNFCRLRYVRTHTARLCGLGGSYARQRRPLVPSCHKASDKVARQPRRCRSTSLAQHARILYQCACTYGLGLAAQGTHSGNNARPLVVYRTMCLYSKRMRRRLL